MTDTQLFCHYCANLLFLEIRDASFFVCKYCPYKTQIKDTMAYNFSYKKKQVDAILGDENWDMGNTTHGL